MTEVDPKAFLGRGWAFPVGYDATGALATVEYEEDVRQAIRIILESRFSERVMRPDFGAGLEQFVFEPINTTTMALIGHRVRQALITWEPRIDVRDVRVRPEDRENGKLAIEIDYRVRAINTFYNLVYPFYLLEGEQR